MKKRRNSEIGKKLMSGVIAMTMAMEFVPGMALAVNAAVNENLVKSLAELYDGDTERARQELEALYEAGIIDENGNMVELDICEDGEAVTLEDVTARITAGEEIGDLTVNGHASTQEQLVKINATKQALKIAKMLAEDVEITDEHVANLESLIQGIADGSVDLDAALKSGSLSMKNMNAAPSLSMGTSVLAGSPDAGDDFPSTKTSTGEVSADSDGKYTAPYFSGKDYNPDYSFQLTDPANKTYFTDSNTEGIAADGLIKVTYSGLIRNPEPEEDTGEEDELSGDTLTVYLKLNKELTVPVSADVSVLNVIAGVTIDVFTDSGATLTDGRGTITWMPGDTTKILTVRVDKDNAQAYQGKRAFVVNIGNIQNAQIADYGSQENAQYSNPSAQPPDEVSAWSKTVKLPINDAQNTAKISATYTDREIGKISSDNGGTAIRGYEETHHDMGLGNQGYRRYYLYQKVDWFPGEWRYPYAFEMQHGLIPTSTARPSMIGLFDASKLDLSNAPAALDRKFSDNEPENGSYRFQCQLSKTVEITSPIMEQIFGYGYGQSSDGNRFLLAGCVDARDNDTGSVTSITVKTKAPAEYNEIMDVSVPAGTYYSGQVIPITVSMKAYAMGTENTKLMVNGIECPLLDSAGTESTRFTFGYTVREEEAVTLNVTRLTGLRNAMGQTVKYEKEYAGKTIGKDNDVFIVSAIKQASLDMANVKYGISDDVSGQVVTVLIPFKQDAKKEWVANEAEECTTDGMPVSLPIPGYENATAGNYLRGAYFSYDNGKTRYPVYVVNAGGEEGVALAARFAAPANVSSYLRKDTVNLFMDTVNIGIEDAAKYLDTWENAKFDAKGYAYFDGTDKEDAGLIAGAVYSYYVKNSIQFDQTAYTSRGDIDYASRTENGFLHLNDGNHVFLQDAANPQNQYDVEIVANDALYQSIMNGTRAEDRKDLTLSWQTSGRKAFTFVDPQYFTWQSSDESIAKIETDEDGVGHVTLTGKSGQVTFSLTVGNGSDDGAYTLNFDTLAILEGKTPFLSISEYSQLRQTLTYTDTDIAFASNVTARNAEADEAAITTFTAKLYKAVPVTGTEYNRTGEPIWTDEFESNLEETLTHITVPGDQMTDAGAYEVVITAKYNGINVAGRQVTAEELTATADIVAKEAPAWIKLNKLDSYYATAGAIPAIGYTHSDKVTEVEYTIQKTGAAVSERKQASGGVIPFAPATPNSLKEAYTITVYARNNPDDDWSIDSMLLTVYNPQILHQIVADVTAGEIGGTTGGKGTHADGTTVAMDNSGKVNGYLKSDGYQLSFTDFTALRTDMSLQKIVSVNYGEAVYGLLSDKMQWESSDSSKVSINYKQGGIYSDINDYSYTSYTPATDLLLVGKAETGDERITITATHANTGISSSFDVTANTLKDQLYVFQFNPAAQTTVIYTNGKGVKRRLESNANGELAVYEPEGITGKVMAMSRKDGATYSKTFDADTLETGERDISALQLYPCNNIRMEEVSRVNLTIQKPDGTPYNGQITIRGGVYKNGTYCPDALISVNDAAIMKNGREDITATVTDGKLQLQLDPEQFKYNLNDPNEYGAQPDDKITYVFEYRTGDTYLPGYVMLNAAGGSSKRTDSLVRLKKNPTGKNTPQIINQSLQLYFDGKPMEQRSDVTNYTDNIGISKRFNKGILYTDVVLLGEPVTEDENGYSVYGGKSVTSFALYTTNNKQLTGQTCNTKSTADQILHLSDMDNSSLFVFPFSSLPSARSSYTITDANLKQDGITDEGTNPTPTSRVKAMLVRDGVTVYTETLPFGLSNLSHQKDLSAADGGVKELGEEIDKELKSKLDMGSIFGDIDVNDMLKKGFVFLSKMQALSGENPINMMILPTADPSRFRIIASIGYDKREMKTDTNPSVDFDPDHLAEDTAEFQKEMKEMMEEEKKKGKKKDKKDEADAGKVSYNINFYGTVILEAQIGGLGKKWDIDFCGGNVGTNFEIKYEWGQNFMCGPVPVTISFEIGATADLEVAFANKSDARALLIDAAVGISIEAFAGLGFDLSLFALKLGIFGDIKAEDNFLYLTKGNQTGNKLDINGEIGIRLEVKVVLVKYKKTFASTKFNWSKTWGKYDEIQETWENEGYADMSGTTKKGKPYTMKLMSNGTALVEIDSGGEIENRDYLTSTPRFAKKRKPFTSELKADGMTELQSNAYPYSNPVLNEDGSMILYISDNDNADEPQSVVAYAVKDGNGYTEKGHVDTSENNILADGDVVVSGTSSNTFAAWVKQMDSPEKEMHDEVNLDDLGMMLNATEIYASAYDGSKWSVERLTENTNADMSPTIASSGNRAIVAWRSLNATAMPEEGSEQDLSAMFNAENSLRYRIYDGNNWKEAQIAYNGTAGTVNAVDSAMLSDGTALLVYSVRTGEDVTSTETFYTLIDPNGDVLTTGRLTNDDYTDTNAQVTTVGDQFVVGWYSEHGENEGEGADDADVSHDIGLARINANGSVDAAFPESLGGTSAASIGSDFHFSAPVNNTDLCKLSIVWSQQKESDKAEDAGKHQLKAVRFYEDNGAIGVTAQTTIAETGKNYTVDHFDTYTDENDEIRVVLVGSDYNDIDGMDVFDTIDLTDLPVQAVDDEGKESDCLAILEQEPTVSMKMAKGSFPKSAIEVNADTDLDDLMPGLNLPVQFTVQNTGTNTVNTVNAVIGDQTTTFTELNLLPGQSTVLTTSYSVPENVRDVNYSLTADDSGSAAGTLVLNRPDVGISSMAVTREGNKERDIRLILSNAANIPLAGSGKKVKLAFYQDSKHTQQIGETITVDPSVYQDIDDSLYIYNQTLNVAELIGDATEVPKEGVRIYASTWVDDTDELYTANNDANVTLKGLLSKYESQITMDAALIADENDDYSIVANISNNSLQTAEVGTIVADVLDSDGNVLTSVDLNSTALTLQGEEKKTLTVKAPELDGEPAQVSLRSSEKSVLLDAQSNFGTSDAVTLALTADNKPAGLLPDATREGYEFVGWFTKPTGGEKVTNDTVLEGGATLYAQFNYTEVVDAEHADFQIRANGYEGIYDGEGYGISVSTPVPDAKVYFSDKPLDRAGFIQANQTASPKFTEAGEHTVYYCITTPYYKTVIDSVTVNITKAEIEPEVSITGWTYGDTANQPTVTGNTGNGTVTYTYYQGETALEKAPTDAGTYTVKATVAVTDNYKGAESKAAAFTIGKKSLTITADNAEKIYGTDDPALTYADVKLVGDDKLTGALSRAEGEDVGEYAITQGTLTAGNNYVITFVSGKFAITSADFVVEASGFNGVYDGKEHGISASAKIDGAKVYYLVSDEKPTEADFTKANHSVSPTYTDAGVYKIWYCITAKNYKPVISYQTVEITKAAITPAVAIESWTFGEKANEPSVSGNTGNGDVTYTYYQGDKALETAPTDAGTYTVKAAIAETANYKGGEASAEFNIINAEFPVTAKGFAGTYDGKAHGISASTKVEGAKVYFSAEKLDEAGFVKANQTASPTFKNAGEHTVWYCITTPDYKTVIGSETVKIAQREITITADSLTSEYGADILPLTYKITGEIVTGDDLHIQVITNATKDAAGTYDITVYYQPDANYSVKVVNGVYTIKEAPETKATSATSETKATGGTTESKATSGTTETTATSGTTESKATGGTTETKATGGTTEPGGTNEPKESGETTEPHATETTSVTNETEIATNTFLPTDDTSFTPNPITTTTIMTDQTDSDEEKEKPKGGCYIATAVYGSYDCPEVWVLRRFRDNILAKTWYGRAFIRTYYAISPTLVKWFGKTDWFINLWKPYLDTMVTNLKDEGFEDTPYQD